MPNDIGHHSFSYVLVHDVVLTEQSTEGGNIFKICPKIDRKFVVSSPLVIVYDISYHYHN